MRGEYLEISGPMRGEYLEISGQMRAQYLEISGPMRAQYLEISGPMRAQYLASVLTGGVPVVQQLQPGLVMWVLLSDGSFHSTGRLSVPSVTPPLRLTLQGGKLQRYEIS